MHVGQVAMTFDLCLGMRCLQAFQQSEQCLLLTGGAGVVGLAASIEAALVAHAERVLVVPPCVGTHELLVARLEYHSSTGHVVVVASEPEAVGMVPDQRPDAVPLVAARGTAMNNNQINSAHDCTKKVDTVSVMTVATYLSTLPMIRPLVLIDLKSIVLVVRKKT